MTRRFPAAQLALSFDAPPRSRSIVRRIERFDFEQRGGRTFRQWLRLCFRLDHAHGAVLMEWYTRQGLYGAEGSVNQLLDEAERAGWIRLSRRSQPTKSQVFFLVQRRRQPVSATNPRGGYCDLWEPVHDCIDALLFLTGVHAEPSEPVTEDASSIDALCILRGLATKQPAKKTTRRRSAA